ncbi:hypothetical protein Noda2021_10680 [Candidatus Dependentiae bacterium Noda2021]|nr:hypothetical protein Noda2021_10680 [Candidatus Dependentiae bacterium Noda2021]
MDYTNCIPKTTDTIKIIKIKLAINDLLIPRIKHSSQVMCQSQLALLISNNTQLKALLKTVSDKKIMIDQLTQGNDLDEDIDNMTLLQAIEYFEKLHKIAQSL